MECGNEFCIYYKNGSCVLRKIRLDRSGMCMECILIELDAEFLEKIRKKSIKEVG